ncbi:hypothetical protein [Nonomuraea sediminis]|uniref:hypothetical protein n=1 Tax=Nonomuraea sediminis TaxID=2835864 RepID=UPI001BDBD782|nr:hypothetical protein [Nonomuraea sediminis]
MSDLRVGEFIGRAYGGRDELVGKPGRPSRAGRPAGGQLVEVTGTWIPWKGGKVPTGFVPPALTASSVRKVDQPAEPYE